MISAGAILCVTDFGGISDNGVVESTVATKVKPPDPGDAPNQGDKPSPPNLPAIADSKDHGTDLNLSETGWLSFHVHIAVFAACRVEQIK